MAEKLENMLLESFRSLGEAGEAGMSWYRPGGVVPSGPLPFKSGEDGLRGLRGELTFSFPPFERMASDKEDDLGIFRSGFRGGLQD